MNECKLVGNNQDMNKSTEKLQICRFDLSVHSQNFLFNMFCSSLERYLPLL